MTAAGRVLCALRPGARVFVQGAVGEPLEFAELLARHPARAAGVEFTQAGIPGINGFDYAGLHPEARLTTFMAPVGLADPENKGRIRLLPLSYGGAAAYLRAQSFDVAVVQVTPPDDEGLCSFGISGDFAPLIWPSARMIIAYVNPDLPRPRRSRTIPYAALDVVIPARRPLPAAPPPSPSAAVEAVAVQAAKLIQDGAILQTGVGGAPAAVLSHLEGRRDLVVRSGLVTDGYMALAAEGRLSSRRRHVAGVAWGSQALYESLHESDVFAFEAVDRTHDVATLGRGRRFTAINSALEVDLFGQANVEWRGGRAVSGVGGAPEFARAAALSSEGMFILALPSRAGGASRLVPRLPSPTVSLPRGDGDVVVTEFGAARLRGLSVEARADALINIAHPDDRVALGHAFERLMTAGPPPP